MTDIQTYAIKRRRPDGSVSAVTTIASNSPDNAVRSFCEHLRLRLTTDQFFAEPVDTSAHCED